MGRDKTETNRNKQSKKDKMAEKKAKKAEQFDITHGKNKGQRSPNGKNANGHATGNGKITNSNGHANSLSNVNGNGHERDGTSGEEDEKSKHL
ncbi:uncharacterized protein I303_106466 [Kwoniella dejecticola CBS 10117]|uniref:Uncharacterized protein n=1 Tax=Kwoniella dejecticola CBS 10117 TaxID=1296121 RepID=A0A1A5ZUM5_9TREE|nr:uncharacterized protein I303_08276 [Kwoniella dejecticola CBS 10117]OBR81506.1 hypothetical protein I303_08276 [Kwoniella dejecticola CBS 10117]